jgi:SAM-dependent MidA family methyltransferase
MEKERTMSEVFDTMDVSTIYSPRMREAVIDHLLLTGPEPVGKLIDWGQYDKDFGYYQQAIVMEEDYQTTPGVNADFGRTLGKTIWTDLLTRHETPRILIAGDGTGDLTLQCLYALRKDDRKRVQLTVVDRTEHLLNMQRNNIRLQAPDSQVTYVESDIISFLENQPPDQFDYAQHNELLDALPLRFYKKNSQGFIRELFVHYENDALHFTLEEPEQTNATRWFLDTLSSTIGSRVKVYQPDAAYLSHLHAKTLTSGGGLTMIDYFKRGPTNYSDIPVLGWDLEKKISPQQEDHDTYSVKYTRDGLASAIQAIGMVDVTLLVDLNPITKTLGEEGNVDVQNQFLFMIQNRQSARHTLQIMMQTFWHTNFSVVRFTKKAVA